MIRSNSRIRIYIAALVLGLLTVSSPQFRDFMSKVARHQLDGSPRRYLQNRDDRIIGKYGFIDKSGAQVLAPTLDETTNFSQGLAAVKMGQQWNIIDKSGKMLLKPRFGAIVQVLPCVFADGLTPMQLDKKWGFVNQSGDWVVKPEFDQVDPFDHGLAKVSKDYEGWGCIDTTGKKVLPLEFQNISSFHNGLAAAENEDGVGLIGKDGRWRVKPRYNADFEPITDSKGEGLYGDGVFVLARANQYAKSGDPITYDWFDTDGRLLSTLTCDHMQQFVEGSATFEQNGHWGFLNKQGKVIVKPTFEQVQPFEYGLGAAQNSDDEWQYFYSSGKRMMRPGTDPMFGIDKPYFSEGLAAMRINGHWGFVNAAGATVIEPRFEEVGDFHEGMVWVMETGKSINQH